jgi:hypothetical protein
MDGVGEHLRCRRQLLDETLDEEDVGELSAGVKVLRTNVLPELFNSGELRSTIVLGRTTVSETVHLGSLEHDANVGVGVGGGSFLEEGKEMREEEEVGEGVDSEVATVE